LDSPYTQRRPVQYRGPSTTDDYNKRIDENYKDLVVLFNRARLSEVELEELYRRMVKDQLSLTRMVEELESRIATLEDSSKRFVFHSTEQIDNDRFSEEEEFLIVEEDRLTLDQRHGILTLPKIDTSSLSKLFFVNSDGDEIVPSTLETQVVGTDGTADSATAIIDSSEPEYALYRKPGLIWERNVVVDNANADGAELTLYVKVPTDLFTNDKSNSIVIHPFPYFGTNVKEIAYTQHLTPSLTNDDGYIQFNTEGHYASTTDAPRARGWVIPGGWTGAYEGQDTVVNAGPRAYYFSPRPITALRIKLHQDNYYRESGKFIYSYGLSQLDLRYDKFLSEGRALIRFDAPEDETISSINDVQPQIWNVSPAALSGVFEYRVVWETYPGSGEPTLSPQPNSSRVWIEVSLKNTQGWTPALSGLIVDYS